MAGIADARLGWALPAIGYVVTALVFRGAPGRAERAIFTRINDGPDRRWLRLPQQLGIPWVLPGLGLVFWVRGRRRDAVVAAAALPVVKGLEVTTKKVLRRPRPLYTTPTELRDDAPVDGPSFPSGHTAIATCATVLASARAPRPVGIGLGAALLASAYVRVHQGAHHPSDTLGGFFLGLTVANALDAAIPQRP
jgi:membrane-associated phospholipid phosphatase